MEGFGDGGGLSSICTPEGGGFSGRLRGNGCSRYVLERVDEKETASLFKA